MEQVVTVQRKNQYGCMEFNCDEHLRNQISQSSKDS